MMKAVTMFGVTDKRPGARTALGRFVLTVFIATAAGLDAQPGLDPQANADQFVMSCQTISGKTTVAELRKRYGAMNVVDAPIEVEGNPEPGTVLFPTVARQRVEVLWEDSERTHMSSFSVSDANSVWHSPEGVRMGSSIEVVERLNGRPFEMWGFLGHGAGFVHSWLRGKLDSPEKESCVFKPRLYPPDDKYELVPEIVADFVSSGDARLRPAKLTVSVLCLEWRASR